MKHYKVTQFLSLNTQTFLAPIPLEEVEVSLHNCANNEPDIMFAQCQSHKIILVQCQGLYRTSKAIIKLVQY